MPNRIAHDKRITSTVLFLLLCFGSPSLASAQTVGKGELSARQVAQRTFPSVVVLVTEDRSGDKYLGSGFFVDRDVVATNYHVIKGATKIAARLVGIRSDGRKRGAMSDDFEKYVTYQVSVLSTDEENDLALLTVHGAVSRPLTLARGRVAVGDTIYVAGNPEGLEGTFSQGIVSALRGSEYVQITAPISHGSSGGPVLNSRGEVVGVAVGMLEEGQNLNFAIPISHLLPQVTRARLLTRSPSTMSRPRRRVIGTKNETGGELDEGGRLISQERYAEAAEAFKSALRLKPDDPKALLGLADAYRLLQKYQEAIDAYNDVIRTHSSEEDQVRASLGVASAYEGLHRYQEAIDVYNDLIRMHPQDYEPYDKLGFDLLALTLHRDDDAMEVLQRGIKAIPAATALYIALSVLLESQGKMSESETILKTAVQRCDDPAYAYLALGLLYCNHLNRCSEAISFYKSAIEKVDRNPETLAGSLGEFHCELGKAYLKIGDRSSAVKEYRLLKSLSSPFADELFNEIYK